MTAHVNLRKLIVDGFIENHSRWLCSSCCPGIIVGLPLCGSGRTFVLVFQMCHESCNQHGQSLFLTGLQHLSAAHGKCGTLRAAPRASANRLARAATNEHASDTLACKLGHLAACSSVILRRRKQSPGSCHRGHVNH